MATSTANITNPSSGVYNCQLTGSSGKLYTVTCMTQAWDELEVTVQNGSESFVFSKTTHGITRVLPTNVSGTELNYATGTASSDTFVISIYDKTTNQPVSALHAYNSISKDGNNYVNVLTMAVEDRPGNASMLDYNDVYISLTWYENKG